jgi:hypothetical protein
MRRTMNHAELVAHANQIRQAMMIAALAALVFAIVAVLLLDSHTGIVDVHVPYAGRYVLLDYKGPMPAGEPYTVGRGLGRLSQILSSIIETSTLGAAGLIIWGLIKRRKIGVYLAIGWLVLVSYAGPIPTLMQPDPPIAVSVPLARAALTIEGPAGPAWMAEKTGWRRYMLAQIAYAEGNRAAAARLSSGLGIEDITSPIEGPYRLQYLQGQAPTMSASCFKFGCLSHAGRRWGELGAALLTTVALVLALCGALTLRVVRRRLAAIDMLVATGRRIKMMA